MLEIIPDLNPLPWLETIQRIAALPSLQPIEWAISSIAAGAGVEALPGGELHEAIGRVFLDRLCAACAVKIEPGRTRIIPWRAAIGRFAALHDDPPVDRITAAMVRDHRRTCAGLPARLVKGITSLPLREQVEAASARG